MKDESKIFLFELFIMDTFVNDEKLLNPFCTSNYYNDHTVVCLFIFKHG